MGREKILAILLVFLLLITGCKANGSGNLQENVNAVQT